MGVFYPVRKAAQSIRRGLVFRRALRRFRSDPAAFADPNHPVYDDLVYGWGNEAWSAHSEYLAAAIQHALRSREATLECGSGLSTILVGTIAQQQGRRHWSLENSPEWAARVQRVLDRYRIDSVTLDVAPLRDYGDFAWYDPSLTRMPDAFSLVLCDGPPGSTSGGRYGLVPVMRDRLAPGCVVLLDDAERAEEHAIAERWKAEIGTELRAFGSDKPYFALEVPQARTDETGVRTHVPSTDPE